MRRTVLSAMIVAVLLGAWNTGAAQSRTKKPAKKPAEVAGAEPAAAPENKILVSVAFAGYDALINDIGWIGKLAGKPGLPKMLEAQVNQMTNGKGLAGLDKKRPWGLTVKVSPAGNEFPIQGFIPVTNLKSLLGALEPVLGEASESEGVYEVKAGNQTLYLKEKDGWAFVAQNREGLANLPANPEKSLGGLQEKYLLAIQGSVRNIPQAFKQMFLPMIQMGMQQGLEQMPGESDQQFELRKKMTEQALQQFNTLINELDTLTLALGVDQTAGNIHLDYALTARPGTKSAKQFSAAGDLTSNFGGFLMADAAAGMNFVSKLQEADIAQMKGFLGASRKNAEQELDKQKMGDDEKKLAKQLLGDLFDVLEKTIETGTLDGGFVLKLAPKSASLAIGMSISEGAKLEGALKRLVEQLGKDQPEIAKAIKLDAGQYEGVRFHAIRLPVEKLDMPAGEKEKIIQLVGPTLEGIIGIGDKAAYLASGRDPTDLIKAVIDRSKSATSNTVPPFRLFVAGGPIARVVAATAEGNEKEEAQKAAKVLDESAGKDRVTIMMTVIPNGAQVRIAVQEGLLRLLSLAPIPDTGDESEAPAKAEKEETKPASEKPAKKPAKKIIAEDEEK